MKPETNALICKLLLLMLPLRLSRPGGVRFWASRQLAHHPDQPAEAGPRGRGEAACVHHSQRVVVTPEQRALGKRFCAYQVTARARFGRPTCACVWHRAAHEDRVRRRAGDDPRAAQGAPGARHPSPRSARGGAFLPALVLSIIRHGCVHPSLAELVGFERAACGCCTQPPPPPGRRRRREWDSSARPARSRRVREEDEVCDGALARSTCRVPRGNVCSPAPLACNCGVCVSRCMHVCALRFSSRKNFEIAWNRFGESRGARLVACVPIGQISSCLLSDAPGGRSRVPFSSRSVARCASLLLQAARRATFRTTCSTWYSVLHCHVASCSLVRCFALRCK